MDLENRDPNNLNTHIRAVFEDVLAEPEGTHSIDCVWKNSYMCYNCSKSCCYKFITALCGICIAMYWGCDFAMTTFDHVWCITPAMRSLSIFLGAMQKFWGAWIQCLCVPLCEACGMCLSRIHITKG